MTITRVPAPCRRGRSELCVTNKTSLQSYSYSFFLFLMCRRGGLMCPVLFSIHLVLSWCPRRSTSAGCRGACQWPSLDARAATTALLQTALAGACTRTQSASSTAPSAGSTTVWLARYETKCNDAHAAKHFISFSWRIWEIVKAYWKWQQGLWFKWMKNGVCEMSRIYALCTFFLAIKLHKCFCV